MAQLQQMNEDPKNFEEVKLVLGLTWQRGRWDGSDGGRGGYGEVLQAMAEAKRYEEGTEEECATRLVEDMQARFQLLNPSEEQRTAMSTLWDEVEAGTVNLALRRCSGLVLEAMGFVESGI